MGWAIGSTKRGDVSNGTLVRWQWGSQTFRSSEIHMISMFYSNLVATCVWPLFKISLWSWPIIALASMFGLQYLAVVFFDSGFMGVQDFVGNFESGKFAVRQGLSIVWQDVSDPCLTDAAMLALYGKFMMCGEIVCNPYKYHYFEGY